MKEEIKLNTTKVSSNNAGRPPLKKNKKKDEKIFVNLNTSQKIQIKKLAEKDDISLSRVCLNALKKAGYIT
ncbi:MAG: hypothetical protein WC279_09370 [Sulfurimonas sp.]|uniref:hypothetical protein n=1 Tax=Sulfurimonas sp. TaxID=2022749 RepID=UPI0035699EC9